MSLCKFNQLPDDIFLEVFTYFDLADIISTLQVCSRLRLLSSSRFMWITALRNSRMERPLPCTVGQNLAKLSLNALLDLASRTHRLKRNWARPYPRATGGISAFRIGTGVRIVAVVPGTPLVFTFSPSERSLYCWNTLTAKLVDTIHVGRVIFHTAHQEEPGQFTLAIVTGESLEDRLNTLAVVRVSYDVSSVACMQSTFHCRVPSDVVGLFVHKDVVGVIPNDPDTLSIFTINMSDRRSIYINTDVSTALNSRYSTSAAAYANNDDIYVSFENDCYLHVYRFPRDSIPYGGTPAHTSLPFKVVSEVDLSGRDTFVTRTPSCTPVEARYQYALVPGNPKYGVHTISVHRRQQTRLHKASTTVRFLPLPTSGPASTRSSASSLASSTRSSQKMVSVPGPLQYGFYKRSTAWQSDIMWTSYTGTYVLLATTIGQFRPSDTQTCFHLVHYEGTGNTECSLHKLIFPRPPADIMSVALEEHCGTLFVTTLDGMLCSVRYA
ncbi:hypothetical protein SERLA73DRAFT_74128 [Serpula lacrymans var. lacrymans S7.3]|uniref:F-box domain-containing protein n=2 Tax=Serpula lacrymans var. lacrymans TaxID=341189 RepID=F8Q0P6_SERL3|nr:uncharacterized protein SERLADRAFT_438766 [Serpula lacrymans var. lacrymans S7.9]EGN97875.1 hypothetical protein SERLA73DRAFT_74128 [Serpula lacrymans var. lacrymans S7.3]EGO23455.1 hypothetical protein SERLADRAFT_438766 [Serpula lacrymans var. lacrymans S7.9]